MRKMRLFRLFIPVLVILSFASCTEFRKIQKSDDWKVKYDAAMEYYENSDYYRSITLFEEILPLIRGREEGEESQFYYAYAHYKDKSYLLAAHYFKSFAETYSRSDHALEAQYMHAYSLYVSSPIYNLDQTSTMEAIVTMQSFINRNSSSEYVQQATDIINELQVKLETKAYYSAKQYHKIGYMKSALIAFDNFSKDYPDSKYNEELQFLKIETKFDLAQQSIPAMRKERLGEVIEYYEDFVDEYPTSDYTNTAQRYYDQAIDNLGKIVDIQTRVDSQINN